MSTNNLICGSCNTSSATTKYSRRGKIDLCEGCRSWVLMSLRRTRRVPTWVRPDLDIPTQELIEMRDEFQELFRRNSREMRHHSFEMGFSYHGPLTDKAWNIALTTLEFHVDSSNTQLPNIPHAVVDEELERLEHAGIVQLPKQLLLRKHLAHLLRGDFGLANKRLLITALFIWLVSDDEFIARVPAAWANSFIFLRDVVNDLGDRASFVDDTIRVTGSSGNTYRIQPKPQSPYYLVTREVEDQRIPICIDPIGADTVVFGDVLVTLTLSLYDDQISARRINTLSQHVFGTPRHLRRLRNRNIDHLWRRALGNAPRPPLTFQHEDPAADPVADPNPELPVVWRHLLDRFQTSLADWTPEGEER